MARPRILVVEDRQHLAALYSRVLSLEGFEVAEAHDGRAALAAIAAAPPELILLDVVLGDVSGIDVVDQLRANPATEHIPIVLMTGLGDPGAGAGRPLRRVEALLAKPFECETLVSTVRAFVTAGRDPDAAGL
jgi:two-component system cell cycle response regulator